MADSIITLTTDFGHDSPYVAAMKGVILGINPAARLVDLSHQIPAQDVGFTAYFLANAIPYYASDVIHVVVVDPGVGSDRALLYAEADGHRLLCPDNGCWTLLGRKTVAGPLVLRLTAAPFWREPVSATFHGRDILAPTAAHLSLGLNPLRLGPPMSDYVRLEEPLPAVELDRVHGEVVFVDHFGNLITNIPEEAVRSIAKPLRITLGELAVPRLVRTYADAEPGIPIALVGSNGRLEIAVNRGSAAEQCRAGIGSPVQIESAIEKPAAGLSPSPAPWKRHRDPHP